MSDDAFVETIVRLMTQRITTHAGIAVQAADTGRVLMQQRALDPEDPPEVRGTWEWPGGGLEDGETPLDGAWREWQEETGLDQPEHEITGTWTSPDGVYQGFLATIPSEDALDLNTHADGNGVINPDDPNRDHPEVACWFTIEHVQDMGAAIRPEVLSSTDWSLFAPTVGSDPDEQGAEMTTTETEKPDSGIIAPVPWFGVIAPEGVKSGDRRMFAPGALRTRPLPLPLTWQKVSDDGHKGNVTVAKIEKTWRQNGMVWGSGHFLQTPEADEVMALIAEFGRYGVSVDADDLDEYAIEMDENGTTVFTDARQASACIVSIPAFAEAFVALGEFSEEMAGGWGTPSDAIPTVEEQAPPADEAEADCSCDENDPNYDPDCTCDEDEVPEDDVTTPDGVAARDVSTDERNKDAEEGRALPDGSFPIDNCSDLSNAIQAIGRAKDPAKAKAHIRKRKNALGCPDVEIPDSWSVDGGIFYIPEKMTFDGDDTAAIQAEFEKALAEGGTVTLSNPYLVGEKGPETVINYTASVPVTPPEGWVATSATSGYKEFVDVAPGKTEDGPGWLTHPVDTDRLRDYWTHGEGAAKIGWGTPGDFNRCRALLAQYIKPEFLSGYCANRHYDALGFWPGRPVAGDTVAFSGETSTVEESGESLTASGPRADLPHEWFTDPGLEGPTALTVTPEGRVFGHLATWGVCHIGIGNACVEAPHSATDYAYFRTGLVHTDKGPVPVGNISIGGGHADSRAGWRAAIEHYDTTSAVVADVAVGEDEFGIWISGAMREGVKDEVVRELQASGGLSGDWREVRRGSGEMELVAALAVNVGGFPVPRIQIAAANGSQISLVAAGVVVESDPVEDLVEEVMSRIEANMTARTRLDALRNKIIGEKMSALRARLGKED